MQIASLILAGGRSSRMDGKDKGLLPLNNRPMIAHVINRLKPQVSQIVISANRHIEQYQKFGYDVLLDDYDDFRGPLAGMARGLSHINSDYLLTVPCDGPLLPLDLAERMLHFAHENQAQAILAFDGKYRQPTYNLIHKTLLSELNHSLKNNEHKLGKWLMDHGALNLDFSDQPSAFINVNTPSDLEQISKILTTLKT